ncbi:hypothetical protein ANO11243_078390 [Dothideomycetidae sp. 11243]|nr:hypothetical protein ANO11243_078390 [fungal sp. No.11243]
MLSIQRPTPTTTLYTVSTRAPSTGLTTKLHRTLLGVGRILTILSVILILYSKSLSLDPSARYCSPIEGTLPDRVAQQTPWTPLLLLAALALGMAVRRPYTEESLLVVRGLGVQTSSSSGTYLSTARTRFIPTSAIQDIFLHEAFKGFEVKFYLAIVVEGEEDLVVVFPKIFPKRQLLEEVWRGTKACLYEPK